MTRKQREPRPTASGWKSQSTGVGSVARREGLMPGYAHQSYMIAMAAGRLAGMAKKRWRDGDPSRMDLKEVQILRGRIDSAFEEIERVLKEGGPGRTGVRDHDAAEAAYEDQGLIGHLGLALMEEAAELAEPIHEVATGRASFSERRPAIESEAADVRTYLHLTDTLLSIDPVGTTQTKWQAFMERMPQSVRQVLTKAPLTQKQIMESLVANATAASRRK
jgi:NTP pyrophosphatase (non-canonical NTP hydrolase)